MNKPLSEMTLKEVQEICKKYDCSECLLDGKICFVNPLKIPFDWKLEPNYSEFTNSSEEVQDE